MTYNIGRAIFAVAFLAIAVTGFNGCKKDSTGPTDGTLSVTVDDGADVMASALGDGNTTQGMASQMADVAILLSGGSGSQTKTRAPEFDTTVVRIGAIGQYSWNYTFHLGYNITGSNTMAFTYGMHGTYETPRMSSDDSASANWVVLGILPADSNCSISGTYNRQGSQTSKVREKNHFTTSIALNLASVVVNKASHHIVSGTVNGTFSVTGSQGGTATWNVTIVFNGNQTATVTLNGAAYLVYLNTGLTHS